MHKLNCAFYFVVPLSRGFSTFKVSGIINHYKTRCWCR